MNTYFVRKTKYSLCLIANGIYGTQAILFIPEDTTPELLVQYAAVADQHLEWQVRDVEIDWMT